VDARHPRPRRTLALTADFARLPTGYALRPVSTRETTPDGKRTSCRAR
jgi:hypothetical protein